jgi:hypothetical protein
MSFNYNNSQTNSQAVTGAQGTVNVNWFKVAGVVDVSAMEFTFGLGTTEAAASASIKTFTVVDGGATGELVATTAALTASQANATADSNWTAVTPRRATGTSSTDLDADDYVNVVYTDVGTATTGAHIGATYIYGKPATIA